MKRKWKYLSLKGENGSHFEEKFWWVVTQRNSLENLDILIVCIYTYHGVWTVFLYHIFTRRLYLASSNQCYEVGVGYLFFSKT